VYASPLMNRKRYVVHTSVVHIRNPRDR
jgi:hypothetical protein